MRKHLTVLLAAIAAALLPATMALAAAEYSLDGGASLQSGGVQLVSDVGDASIDNDFSTIGFADTGVSTFETLTTLSADYNVTDDDCGGGSPRFQIAFGESNLFVYFGPAPEFTGCATGTVNTGNLIESDDARFDLSQFGGAFYGTYDDALALLGDETVTGITLAVDGGWAFEDQEQTVLVDNVAINDTTFTFAPVSPPDDDDDGDTPAAKDACKNGGWEALGFRNQGQCVSSVVSNRGGNGSHGE